MDNRERYQVGRRNIAVVSAVNLALFPLKLGAGFFGRSQAMMADAIHTLADLLSSLVALVGLRLGARPEDGRHPYGHGKFETVSSAVLSIMLALVGVLFLSRSIDNVLSPNRVVPGILPLGAALVSMAVKEFLYRYSLGAAGRIDSSALKADAWHHRSDALSSLPAFFGVLAARLGQPLMDPLMGALIAVMVIRVALVLLSGALHELVEGALDDRLLGRISATALAVPGVQSIHDLRGRRAGPDILVDMHVQVDGGIDVRAGHRIADEVERRLMEAVPGVSRVIVHVDPAGR